MTQPENTTSSTEKKTKTYLWFSIIILIIGILSTIERSNFDPVEFLNGSKECFSNQQMLEEAIKKYNNHKRVENIIPGGDFEKLEKEMVRTRYLKDYLVIPTDKCSYGFVTINGKGTVFCNYHGTTESEKDKPIVPKYDKTKEKPFSSEYLKYRKEIENSIISKTIVIKLIRDHLYGPVFIFFAFVYFALYIDALLKERKKQVKKD